jgi:hypothetical protein
MLVERVQNALIASIGSIPMETSSTSLRRDHFAIFDRQSTTKVIPWLTKVPSTKCPLSVTVFAPIWFSFTSLFSRYVSLLINVIAPFLVANISRISSSVSVFLLSIPTNEQMAGYRRSFTSLYPSTSQTFAIILKPYFAWYSNPTENSPTCTWLSL